MNIQNNKIYLTGATGQIGSALRTLLKLHNLEVTILCRKELSTYSNEKFIRFQLGDSLAIDCNDRSVILIHLAHDYFDKTAGKSNVNSVGLNRLLESFKPCSSLKIIYFSTPTHLHTTISRYQEQKLIGEKICEKENSLILKPSIVFSKKSGINRLFYFLSLFRAPVLLPNVLARIAPLSDDKLAELIISEPTLLHRTGKFLVLGQEKMSFEEYLYRFHKLKTIKVNDRLTRCLLFVLGQFPFGYSFYLHERISGLIRLVDINDLLDSHASLVV